MFIAGLVAGAHAGAGAGAGPVGHQEAPKTDETVPVQSGGRLSINNFAGEVIIHTWDKDSVHVVARHQSRTKVIIRPSAAGLSITATGTMGPQGSVDYDITAPAWMPIKVEGTYNFVTMDGVQGEVFANTMRGDIVIKGGTGTITAKSVEGEVQVDGARGKVNVSSVNEKIRITDTSGEITAESINGAITMTGIDSKSVDASTVNGNDHLRRQAGRRRALQLRHPQRRSPARRAGKRQRDLHHPDLPGQLQHRPAAARRQPRGHPARPPRGDDARQRQRRREPGNLRRVDPGPAGDRHAAARAASSERD